MSWPAGASSVVAVAAALWATAVTPTTPGALVCDPQSQTELAAQADVVFTGKVTALVVDYDTTQAPPPILNPFLKYWPKQVPVPTVPTQAPGQGSPAARFQVATAYKGRVSSQMTVRLLGTERRFRTGETWTVFADRSHGYLFTTECSGDQPNAINPEPYGLTARPPQPPPNDRPPAQLWWALGALALLALAGAAAAAFLAAPYRRRPAPADLEPR